jgi:hypothetical protein
MDPQATAPQQEPVGITPIVAIYTLVSLFGGLIAGAIFSARDEPPIVLGVGAIGFVLSQTSLLAVWIGFGNISLPLRLIVGIPLAGLAFMPILLNRATLIGFGAGYLAVLVVACPLLLMRIVGHLLVNLSQRHDAVEPRSKRMSFQFTLREMFGWTLSAAMVAALARFVFDPMSRESRGAALSELMISGGVCIALGAVSCASVWASLGNGSPGIRLPIAVVLVAIIAALVCGLLGAGSEVVVVITLSSAMVPFLAGAALLMLRSVGFRLVGPRSRIARDDPYLKQLSKWI